MKRQAIAVLSLILAACAAVPGKSRITDAAATPLNDLNLFQTAIPAILVEAQKYPYAAPADQSCNALSAELLALDDVLGPDLDAPPSTFNPSLIERGASFAGDTAIGALRGAAEGILPFRKWVRKLSGAERYLRKVAAAITAGTARRSFLKGMSVAHGCS